MKLAPAACLMSVSLLAGCSRFGLDASNRDKQADFDKKLTCGSAAERVLKVHGSWYTDEHTYVDQSFFSPKRNSCVAVLILTTGSLNPGSSGELGNTLSDTYDIVDTLTYEVIRHASSGTGPDRTKTMDEINKEVSTLKE